MSKRGILDERKRSKGNDNKAIGCCEESLEPENKPRTPRPRRANRIESDLMFKTPEPNWLASRRMVLLEATMLRGLPVAMAAHVLNIGRSTAYRWIKQYRSGQRKVYDQRYRKDLKKSEKALELCMKKLRKMTGQPADYYDTWIEYPEPEYVECPDDPYMDEPIKQ